MVVMIGQRGGLSGLLGYDVMLQVDVSDKSGHQSH